MAVTKATTGRRAVPVAGVVLLVLAAVTLAHPGWAPEAFTSPR